MARADATGAWDGKARDAMYDQALDIARKYVKPDDLLLAHLNLEAGIHLLRDGNVAESESYLNAAYSQYHKQIAANDPRLLIASLVDGQVSDGHLETARRRTVSQSGSRRARTTARLIR